MDDDLSRALGPTAQASMARLNATIRGIGAPDIGMALDTASLAVAAEEALKASGFEMPSMALTDAQIERLVGPLASAPSLSLAREVNPVDDADVEDAAVPTAGDLARDIQRLLMHHGRRLVGVAMRHARAAAVFAAAVFVAHLAKVAPPVIAVPCYLVLAVFATAAGNYFTPHFGQLVRWMRRK